MCAACMSARTLLPSISSSMSSSTISVDTNDDDDDGDDDDDDEDDDDEEDDDDGDVIKIAFQLLPSRISTTIEFCPESD